MGGAWFASWPGHAASSVPRGKCYDRPTVRLHADRADSVVSAIACCAVVGSNPFSFPFPQNKRGVYFKTQRVHFLQSSSSPEGSTDKTLIGASVPSSVFCHSPHLHTPLRPSCAKHSYRQMWFSAAIWLCVPHNSQGHSSDGRTYVMEPVPFPLPQGTLPRSRFGLFRSVSK